MLLGHIGAAFVGKTIDLKTPILIYIIAALVPDLASVIVFILEYRKKCSFFVSQFTFDYNLWFCSFYNSARVQ